MKNLYRNTLIVLVLLALSSLIPDILFTDRTSGRIFVAVSDGIVAAGLIFLLISFSKKLSKINRQIQLADSGSFTTEFPEKIHDELDMLTLKLSKLFKDINKYDRLRAKNVAKSGKAFESISMNISEAVILADFEENTAILNPAAQKIWNLETRSFPLDIVVKHAQNIEFNKFLERVAGSGEEKAEVSVYFPSASRREVSVKAVPIKTMDEKTTLILLFVKKSAAKKPSPSPES